MQKAFPALGVCMGEIYFATYSSARRNRYWP